VQGTSILPPNVAKKGGISHNVKPVALGNGAARLQAVPAIKLPPFAGLGKKRSLGASIGPGSMTSSISIPSSVAHSAILSPQALESTPADTENKTMAAPPNVSTIDAGMQSPPLSEQQITRPTIVVTDVDTSSDEDAPSRIHGHYYMNEDDRILMEDVLMCPFMFRSQDAVNCGSVSECVMPGMLRAQFTSRNKLHSLELVYDAMGIMQQLARASGQEGSAQIVPGSVEMALTPTATEARVITMAQPPYLIMNVNEVWTRITGYTQMDVEGKEYLTLLEGEGTVADAKKRRGRPPHLLDEVTKGRPACSTNIHYDKNGVDFIEFVCSYPLTNEEDEITHILHVSKELPSTFHTGPFDQ
jgi:hypothetical protein